MLLGWPQFKQRHASVVRDSSVLHIFYCSTWHLYYLSMYYTIVILLWLHSSCCLKKANIIIMASLDCAHV